MTNHSLEFQVFDKLKKLLPSVQREVVLQFGVQEEHLRWDTQSSLAHDVVRVAKERENGLQALDAVIQSVTEPRENDFQALDSVNEPAQQAHPPAKTRYSLPMLVLLLGVLGGGIFWVAQRPPDLHLEIQQASRLADLGWYAQAEQAYQALLEKHPQHPKVQAQADKLRAMLSLFEGKTFHASFAQQRFQQLLQRFPDDPRVLALQGHTQMRLGQVDAARRTYQRILQHTPAHPDTLFGLGNVYLYEKNYPQAARYYAQALEQAPEHVPYLLNLGYVSIQQDQFEQGIQHYRKVLRWEPDYLPVYLEIAEAYRHQGETQKAQQGYRKLIALMADEALRNLPKNQDAWWLGGERWLYSWKQKRDYARQAAGLGNGNR